MTGLVVGISILGLFLLLVDVLAWNAFCRAIKGMEWTEDEATPGKTPEAPSRPSWPLRRAYGTYLARHHSTSDQG